MSSAIQMKPEKVQVSFLMMAKNVESFIADSIEALLILTCFTWELIIIDDSSEDRTFLICQAYQRVHRQIKVYPNIGQGKVVGTNYAYSLSRGEIIKCIDSDDILLPAFVRVLDIHMTNDLVYHASAIVNSQLQPICTYFPGRKWMTTRLEEVICNPISLPKWAWSFTRELASKIFPIPTYAPYEDIWMSIMLKVFSISPYYLAVPVYLYRQHARQTFGGILNYSPEIMLFRARRNLIFYSELQKDYYSLKLIQNANIARTIAKLSYVVNVISSSDKTKLSVPTVDKISIRFALIAYKFMPYIARLTYYIRSLLSRKSL